MSLKSSNLQAIAHHLEKGKDNGGLEREALAVFLRSVASELNETEQLRGIVKELLNHLPDSSHEGRGDESWDWCWNELSSTAQDAVVAIRAKAIAALNGPNVQILQV